MKKNRRHIALPLSDRFVGLQILCVLVLFILSGFSVQAAGSHIVTTKDVEISISEALQQQGAGEAVNATLTGKFNDKLHQSNEPVTVEVHSLDFTAQDMKWNAELRFFDGEKLAQTLPVEGRFENLIAVPVLNKRLHRGDMIEEADIAFENIPEHRLRKDTILSADELIGNSPRRVISENRPVRSSEVEHPQIVTKGDLIQVRFLAGTMTIQTMGEALDTGAKGDTIRIRNTDSNIVVQATIAQPGMADVKPLMQLSQN